MKLIYLCYFGFPLIVFSLLGFAGYYRISGDIQICRIYYKEMSLAQCYFSSKTVRVPEK